MANIPLKTICGPLGVYPSPKAIFNVGEKRNKNRHQAWHGVRKGVNPAPRNETQGFL